MHERGPILDRFAGPLDGAAFARLLGAVYDCALAPADWCRTLEALAIHWRSAAVSVELQGGDPGDLTIFEYGSDLKYLRRLLDDASGSVAFGYDVDTFGGCAGARLTDFAGGSFQAPSQQGVCRLRPSGYRDFIVVDLLREDSRRARLSVARSTIQRVFATGDRADIARIIPHLGRSLAIANALDLATVEARSYEGVLHALPAPIAITDESRRPRFLNAAAERLVRSADVLRLTDGCLDAVGHGSEGFAAAFASAGRTASTGPCASTVLKRGVEPVAIAHVLSLEDDRSDRPRWAGPESRAIFLVQPRQTFRTMHAAFASLYGLSASEIQLVALLANGGGIDAVASQLRISRNTVKTHLQRVFEKTGTARQAELIRRYLACQHTLHDPRTTSSGRND
jgi:DNA-binding CsgD family transcriptional regulator/PAS domain-containing protein